MAYTSETRNHNLLCVGALLVNVQFFHLLEDCNVTSQTRNTFACLTVKVCKLADAVAEHPSSCLPLLAALPSLLQGARVTCLPPSLRGCVMDEKHMLAVGTCKNVPTVFRVRTERVS